MLDTLWQAWKGFLLDTAELSFSCAADTLQEIFHYIRDVF